MTAGCFVPPPSCWRVIGVGGSRTCPELAEVVHCRNCAVLARAAQALLERPAPPGYADFCGAVVAAAAPAPVVTTSVLVFRLATEWLAIATATVVEIADLRPVRRIAHRSHSLVSGLVNIRGQLHLTVALAGLLDIADPLDATAGPAHGRLVVIAQDGETWVFHADEVHGVIAFAIADLSAPPATLPAPLAAVTRGVFPWAGQRVTSLDAGPLFVALRRVAG
jgi:chemotaxis-related protein WspD